MALRGIMQSDPEQALSDHREDADRHRTRRRSRTARCSSSARAAARGRATSSPNVAKGNANPDLQLRAIRYLGIMGGADNRQVLADVYKSSPDVGGEARDPAQLHGRRRPGAAARGRRRPRPTPELRGEAVQQLGVMHAGAELNELYQTETSVEVKKRDPAGDVRRRRSPTS